MIHRKLAFLITVGLLAVAAACSLSADTGTKQMGMTIETSRGEVKVTDTSTERLSRRKVR
jgi:hypothetical protein